MKSHCFYVSSTLWSQLVERSWKLMFTIHGLINIADVIKAGLSVCASLRWGRWEKRLRLKRASNSYGNCQPNRENRNVDISLLLWDMNYLWILRILTYFFKKKKSDLNPFFSSVWVFGKSSTASWIFLLMFWTIFTLAVTWQQTLIPDLNSLKNVNKKKNHKYVQSSESYL